MKKKKKYPQLIYAEELCRSDWTKAHVVQDCPFPSEADGKCWEKARPIATTSIKNRLKLAYGVFTGKYDALKWTGQ